MFRIGIVELALTCVIILLAFIVPVIVTRFSKRIDARLKHIEERLDKKDK